MFAEDSYNTNNIEEFIPESKEWIEDRKLFITGTDCARIIKFLEYGETEYYDRSICNFTYDKLHPEEIVFSPFMQAKMKEGQIYETLVYNQYKDMLDIEITKNRQVSKGIFKATLDIELNFEDAPIIVEVKYTTGHKKFKEFKDMRAPAFYQVACQLYCHPHKDVSAVLKVKYNDSITKEQDDLEFIINKNSECYIIFEKYLNILHEFHNCVKRKVEWTDENLYIMDEHSILKESLIELHNINEDIKRKELEKEILENNIKEYVKTNNIIKNDTKQKLLINKENQILTISLSKQAKKTINEIYKDEYDFAMDKIKSDKEVILNSLIGKYNDFYNIIDDLRISFSYKK